MAAMWVCRLLRSALHTSARAECEQGCGRISCELEADCSNDRGMQRPSMPGGKHDRNQGSDCSSSQVTRRMAEASKLALRRSKALL